MSIPLQILQATETRYSERSRDRDENLRKLDAGLVLQADSPQRIEKRLKRLGFNPNLATGDLSATTFAKPSIGFGGFSLKRLFRKNDLISVSYLEQGVQVARAVGRIQIYNTSGELAGYGTGFMVSRSLMLTNHHVLPSRQIAAYSQVEFNFQNGVDRRILPSQTFDLAAELFFLTDATLDYTLVAVSGNLSDFGWIPLIEEEGKIVIGESVSIIQHPGGEPKQVALRENQLIDVLPNFLHYQTDTAPGSSGAPVFNDEWEVVALHHSGVPQRDSQGRILSIDGTLWNETQGEQQVAWLANEGTRISQIVRHVKQQNLSLDEQNLRNQMFDKPSNAQPPASPDAIAPQAVQSTIAPIVLSTSSSQDGIVTWTIPLQVSVRLGQPTLATDATPAPQAQPSQPALTLDPLTEAELGQALEELKAARNRTYYDEASDRRGRDEYYQSLPSLSSLNPSELYHELKQLLQRTHTKTLSYKPSKYLYPWIDLRPDLKLRSIYSGQAFNPEDIIREDLQVDRIRALRAQELKLKESAISPERMAQELSLLEASLPYNCEHVVPQSWFDKREPMRGDLHHLFTCEVKCNSFRGNSPYFDFPDFEESIRDRCGKLSERKFEPSAGKGPVARATLYFLLRYPAQIDQTTKEYQQRSLATLLQWHQANPVREYEKHRNAAIFEQQGNRNPLIDFPEWAEKIAFNLGLG